MESQSHNLEYRNIPEKLSPMLICYVQLLVERQFTRRISGCNHMGESPKFPNSETFEIQTFKHVVNNSNLKFKSSIVLRHRVINQRSYYSQFNSAFHQNPEFRNTPENFKPCNHLLI